MFCYNLLYLSRFFQTLANLVKKGVLGLVAFELAAAGSAYLGFCHIRRSEPTREYLYRSWPKLSDAYYWAEDSISFGQLTGSRLRLSDQRRWAQLDAEEVSIESD